MGTAPAHSLWAVAQYFVIVPICVQRSTTGRTLDIDVDKISHLLVEIYRHYLSPCLKAPTGRGGELVSTRPGNRVSFFTKAATEAVFHETVEELIFDTAIGIVTVVFLAVIVIVGFTIVVIATVFVHAKATVANTVPIVNRQSGTASADHIQLPTALIEPGAASRLVSATREVFAHCHGHSPLG
jgi:hypothetical protein